MTPQAGLFLSAIAFVGLHFLLSHPLRAPLVRRLGEKGFQGLYSVQALLTFGLHRYFDMGARLVQVAQRPPEMGEVP